MSGFGGRVLGMLGVNSAQGLLAWGAAGGIAYYVWVKPEAEAQQQAADEHKLKQMQAATARKEA
eukprot:CAMPEP_0183790892 /NCGR_PEP_ID=MMETSP0803_2-20130417/1452_1 /TAXON_ID=195967 /ORGANISM="Crustomastix stigmata, Strain CCMP3273" /LENGTH=63 /DNA_ID=CAMNT_0026035169 /DNA_START=34 /DNA_END=221 /DNA_ORIENTATION=-